MNSITQKDGQHFERFWNSRPELAEYDAHAAAWSGYQAACQYKDEQYRDEIGQLRHERDREKHHGDEWWSQLQQETEDRERAEARIAELEAQRVPEGITDRTAQMWARRCLHLESAIKEHRDSYEDSGDATVEDQELWAVLNSGAESSHETPKDWKLVPIKPTAEMKAACRVAGKLRVWDDMIAAAPPAPTGEE